MMHVRLPVPGSGWIALLCLGAIHFVAGAAVSRAADADLMVARPCPASESCSNTWTLTSRLGQILSVYEKALGARTPKFRLLGIEFTTAPRPRVWYPDFGRGHRTVIIQLTQRSRRDRRLALFQLGHEAFHLIAPVKPNTQASMLEEGLASYFALTYLQRIGINDGENLLPRGGYRRSYHSVRKIAALYKIDFFERVRRLRELHDNFSVVSVGDLHETFPKISRADARLLAAPFQAAD